MTDGEALARPCHVEGAAEIGPPSPVASLFAEVSGELRRLVLGVVRDPELAEDVMQSTFVKALEHGHEARAETSRGWLFRVAFHEALAAKRRQASRDRGHRRLAGFRPSEGAKPDEGLIRSETVEAVREALGQLSEDQLRVVRARVFEEKTFAEIAGETGLPLGTVLTRMRRALEKMRRTLRPGD
jgi:RNA polymerase sigma-70 factor, ECF subfamily